MDEIRGKHHRIFVDPEYAKSPEYAALWDGLRNGTYDAGEYERFGKNGESIWIQASYNPILDADGRPMKVVKYATDITAQKQAYADFRRVVEALAQGDLTVSMEGRFTDDLALMQTALNASIGNLAKMMTEIRDSSTTITSSTNEIFESASSLGHRTESQASSLEETSSSIEELSGTVRQNAENAAQANTLASEASTEATKGGEIVQRANDAMGAINAASKRIADIIGVIDEIAFQTNLLALNAAVEAARAGEQGRGFAVVAAEVRNLAQRSAEAAKEIKGLIADSVEKVDEGTRLVNGSGEALEGIVAGVRKVSSIIAEIAAASQEQASGIDEVARAITQLDEITQQNASMVEESTAASESTRDQARRLSELVSAFRTA